MTRTFFGVGECNLLTPIMCVLLSTFMCVLLCVFIVVFVFLCVYMTFHSYMTDSTIASTGNEGFDYLIGSIISFMTNINDRVDSLYE